MMTDKAYEGSIFISVIKRVWSAGNGWETDKRMGALVIRLSAFIRCRLITGLFSLLPLASIGQREVSFYDDELTAVRANDGRVRI